MRILIVCLLALAGAQENIDRAVVTLSDGTRFEGEFYLTEGVQLKLFETGQKKWYQIDPGEVARVSVTVEEERMQQGWMFKEESDNTKIKLPFHYPVRKLLASVTLTGGQVLRGHVTSVFYLETADDEELRFFLQASQRGEKGQTLEDLVYTKEIILPNRKVGEGKTGTIQVSAPGAEAMIVSIDKHASFAAPFTNLLPGKYDIYLHTPKKIYYGLSGTKPTDEERARAEKKIEPLAEFFDNKRIVAAAKTGANLRALVELTRTRESHDKDEQKRPYRYARWEVWVFEPTEKSWDIKKRMFLFRVRYTADDEMPDTFAYEFSKKLTGVDQDATVEFKAGDDE
ncbi:MAG: hypothetical protein ACYTAF_10275 [Planctomycetota bacterium]|jgi:hypothetical protein